MKLKIKSLNLVAGRPIAFINKNDAETLNVHVGERVVISKNNIANPLISCDGTERIPIEIGSRIRIQQHSKKLTLIHPEDYDYFETLREKLGWQK